MSEWDAWFGTQQLPNATDWTFEMPQQHDLMRFNPSLTGEGLQGLLDLGNIGAASGNNWQMPAAPQMPGLQSNARGNPWMTAMTGQPGPGGAGSGGGPGPVTPGSPGQPWWKSAGGGALDMARKNPAALLALLGAGGAGIAGAIKGSERAKLPGDVQNLMTRATAPAAPDPYAEAQLDRTMRRDIGPGWETSTPGIQAKEYAAHLRQQGDRGAAAAALGPVSNIYAQQDANKSKEQQQLFQLAALLGTMGLGTIGRQGFSV